MKIGLRNKIFIIFSILSTMMIVFSFVLLNVCGYFSLVNAVVYPMFIYSLNMYISLVVLEIKIKKIIDAGSV